MAGSVSGEIKAEPNLTPLLDVVFQLITFFMLVINFSADTYDQRVRLPVATTATPPEPGQGLAEDRLVFNVNQDGKLLFNGQELDTESAIKEIRAFAEKAMVSEDNLLLVNLLLAAVLHQSCPGQLTLFARVPPTSASTPS